MALLPTIGPYLLPLVASRIRKKLPRLDLMLYEYQTGPMLEHLQAGDIDVGILALPVPADGLEQRELYDEPFVVAVPDNACAVRAASRCKPRTSTARRCCCSRTAIACATRRWRSAADSDAQEKQDFRATSLETLRQMVASGGGITLLPATREQRRLRQRARRRDRAVLEARAGAAHRRAVAPHLGTQRGDQCRLRRDRRGRAEAPARRVKDRRRRDDFRLRPAGLAGRRHRGAARQRLAAARARAYLGEAEYERPAAPGGGRGAGADAIRIAA